MRDGKSREVGAEASRPPAPPGPGKIGDEDRERDETGFSRGAFLVEAIVRGGRSKLTGKGVIIAILDFRRPDFIRLAANGKPVSRILRFWDRLSDAHDSACAGSDSTLSFSFAGRPAIPPLLCRRSNGRGGL